MGLAGADRARRGRKTGLDHEVLAVGDASEQAQVHSLLSGLLRSGPRPVADGDLDRRVARWALTDGEDIPALRRALRALPRWP